MNFIMQQKKVIKKVKKTSVRKPREINLYSPEYLAKKHGINLNETNDKPGLMLVNEEEAPEKLPPNMPNFDPF